MIVKIICLSLDSMWVVMHMDRVILPIASFVYALRALYGNKISVLESGIADCSISIQVEDNDEAVLLEKIKQIVRENLQIEGEISEVAEITIFDSSPLAETVDSSITDLDADTSKPMQLRSIEDMIKEKPTRAATAADKIRLLIGSQEFKALAVEFSDVAPLIVSKKTQSCFMIFSYLFAINDGFGCSTYVRLFTELLSELSLIELDPLNPVIEKQLPPPCKVNNGPSLDDFLDSLTFSTKTTKVFCFDISEWLSQTADKRFRSFLISLRRMQNHAIFIFRVPFLEKEVLRELKRSLNDILMTREVSFIPMGQFELRERATADLRRYGYSMQKSAWEVFDTRIAEEKSDGKFYGIHTVDKVVKEMIYLKQRSSTYSGLNDAFIKRSDIITLAETFDQDYVSGFDMLHSLIGINPIQEKAIEIIAQVETAIALGNLDLPCLHMRFIGNAGTGKTTVARIIGKIFKEKGILRNGNFFEYSGRDLCGTYVGETAPKTAGICRDAYGSVLFIDEAYTLYNGSSTSLDYGREALSTLITEMENHRTDLLVIMAGYPDEMENLMKGNPGIESRVPYVIEFPNYSREDLCSIFLHMAEAKFTYSKELPATVRRYFDSISENILNAKEFSNARFVRNLFERTWGKAAVRMQFKPNESLILLPEDFDNAVSGNEFNSLLSKKEYRIGFF